MENLAFRNTIFRPLSASKCVSCYSVTLIVYKQLRPGDEYVNIFMYYVYLEAV